MNLIESLLSALKAHGARQIFGIPGDFALPYFRIIEESRQRRASKGTPGVPAPHLRPPVKANASERASRTPA